jgi:hypothetical protein
MTLHDFYTLLSQHSDKRLQLVLPNGQEIAQSFHVTEVGRVQKTFLDCGGKLHQTDTCQIQAWVGDDEDHRLAVGKLLKIFQKSALILPGGGAPLEIEYEDEVMSQYPIASFELKDESIIFHLERKHTDCLAMDVCLPTPSGSCKPGSGCC